MFLLTEWAFHFRLGRSLNLMFASLKRSPPPKWFSSRTQEINTVRDLHRTNGEQQAPSHTGNNVCFFTTFEWIPETSIKKQILKETTFYLLCIKTFNIKLYHLMLETKETRITYLEQQYTSQTAFKQDKWVKILATLREIKNRQSTKFKDFSPRAIPSTTKSSIHARKSEI